MRFTSLAGIFAFASTSLCQLLEVQLFVESEDESVNGLGLYSVREGAGVFYFLLQSEAQTLIYDDGAYIMYTADSTDAERYSVGIDGNVLQASIGFTSSPRVDIDENGLVSFGQDLFAKQDINDPYNYSADTYAVVTDEDGLPIRILATVISGETTTVETETEATGETPITDEVETTEEPTSAADDTTITDEVVTTEEPTAEVQQEETSSSVIAENETTSDVQELEGSGNSLKISSIASLFAVIVGLI